MTYDPRVHQRRSIRLPAWDYREAGAYFVTIGTARRECVFDDQAFRKLAEKAWSAIVGGSVVPEDGYFVVMPNHVHGVVFLDAETSGARHQTALVNHDSEHGKRRLDRSNGVPHASPLRIASAPIVSPSSGSLGMIVASFKSLTARCINRARNTPGAAVWQRNYYERIVRDEDELVRIREYIRDNPRLWAEDPENPITSASEGTAVSAPQCHPPGRRARLPHSAISKPQSASVNQIKPFGVCF
jgi:putative transposase